MVIRELKVSTTLWQLGDQTQYAEITFNSEESPTSCLVPLSLTLKSAIHTQTVSIEAEGWFLNPKSCLGPHSLL